MIDVGNKYFMCDECPIIEGIDHRLCAAKAGGYTPQLEYCGCDKVQTEFFVSGYCEDAHGDKPHEKKKGRRKTGIAYRRAMKDKHKAALTRIINYDRYNPWVGFYDWGYVDGVWQQVGQHIKYPRNSNVQRYWKRHSNKVVRRSKEAYQGNGYRKCFDVWWNVY